MITEVVGSAGADEMVVLSGGGPWCGCWVTDDGVEVSVDGGAGSVGVDGDGSSSGGGATSGAPARSVGLVVVVVATVGLDVVVVVLPAVLDVVDVALCPVVLAGLYAADPDEYQPVKAFLVANADAVASGDRVSFGVGWLGESGPVIGSGWAGMVPKAV